MYLTINISSKEVRVLSANKQGVRYWSRKELPPGWIKEGYISDPKGVGATIAALLEPATTSHDHVVVCVAGLPFTYRTAEFPPMKQSILKESVRHFMTKEISMPVEQMCLSSAVIDESDVEVKLLILGIDQKIIDAIVETMKEARIKYWTMDLKSLALARAASTGNAIVISAESDSYDVVIINSGNVSTMHTVSTDGQKRSSVEHAKHIIFETSKAITYDAKSHGHIPEKSVPLLLTGELSFDKDFRDLIQTDLEREVKLLNPPLALQADFPVHLYSTNIGLALTGIVENLELVSKNGSAYNDINLDIMSGRCASHPRRISSVALVLPVILSFSICLALPFYAAHVKNDMDSLRLQNRLATVNQQIQHAKLTDLKAKEIERKTNSLYSQLENLRSGRQELFSNQGNSAINLRKVVNALPAQRYFTNVNLLPQQITVRGQADDAFQALEYAKTLEREGLFSNIRMQQIGIANADNVSDSTVTFEVIINK